MRLQQEALISGTMRKRLLRLGKADNLDAWPAGGMTLHAQTTSKLRDLIVEGDLAQGQRLVEIDLCRRLVRRFGGGGGGGYGSARPRHRLRRLGTHAGELLRGAFAAADPGFDPVASAGAGL